uniref:Uncharacterized protein n=1 Tax=Arundo donax TaxID=35708 RepID=A0A0A9B3U2_ARUDO
MQGNNENIDCTVEIFNKLIFRMDKGQRLVLQCTWSKYRKINECITIYI